MLHTIKKGTNIYFRTKFTKAVKIVDFGPFCTRYLEILTQQANFEI